VNIESLLMLGTIGLPIIGALLLWRWGNEHMHAQRWATAITLGVTGLVALTFFLISKQYACAFLGGIGNCAFEGLGSLSVLLLILVSTIVSVQREFNERHDYSFMLLLSSTWAGIVYGGNLSWVISLIFITLLLIVVGRWNRARGSTMSYFFSRHEHNPDYPDYQDDERPKDDRKDE
jgi:formate hydrogenlyase subunit 3/multisubunit Na+/H+ antiporter MnhD subunit